LQLLLLPATSPPGLEIVQGADVSRRLGTAILGSLDIVFGEIDR
jgi:hypothetical protein